ncbi:arsenite efflux MFS transporter ArsK [Phyllobacterium zundukense]|uniref:Arsenite efflux MFS transporter ArsK n=1 Tax=Phyllobacterium zundukense TaxID=1867719 RepID=A0ACD4CXC6_9HYPH|nr:arsenite efflux MFS transporter ArsK [Phyllobacterium zundukense]UXN58235.1 arsenite efflux MFS transporter ArsK [Phyllobacterium zundukense]
MTTSTISATDSRLAVAALGLTQIIGYGTLYYSFSALADSMAKDVGWSSEWVFAAFSISLLAGGLAAPIAGGWIDRYGAGRVMALGSIAAAVTLAACALAPTPFTFGIGLMAVELASTFVLYNAAFALLVQINPKTAQRSITHLTLIAGFASTIFWPLTSALHQNMTWQEVYFVFATAHLFVCLPVHFWLSRMSGNSSSSAEQATAASHFVVGSVPAGRTRSAFVLMVSGIALISFIDAAILIHMLPMLGALGLGSVSVLVGTLFGPAQVTSRLLSMLTGNRIQPLGLALISSLLVPVSIAVLLWNGTWMVGAVGFAILFGLGVGLSSIVQGTLPLALFGSNGYGRRMGKVTSARLVSSAAAPFAFAFMMQHVGTVATLVIFAALGFVGLVSFALIGRPMQRVLVREPS